jgi:cysteine desulfuration protein SufE
MIIEMGRSLPVMPEVLKTDASRVKGCMSQVWMSVKTEDPFDFWVDSDSSLVKGLAAVLRMIYVGRPKSELASVDVAGVFTRLDLDNHISPNRRNGFFSMVERIRSFGARS